VFADLLPPKRVRWINTQAKRLRRASNDARDDDVFALRLAQEQEAHGAKKLLRRVQRHRADVQTPIVKAYHRAMEDGRLPRRCRKLLKRIRLGEDASFAQEPTFGPWAVKRLRDDVVVFFEAADADLTNDAALHRFRIAGKRLRYAIELLAGAFERPMQTAVYPVVESLQDRLGALNDHAVAQIRLGHWLESAKHKDETEYLAAAQESEARLLAQHREEFFAWWTDQQKQRLRQMCRELTGA
jgi:CHAD domain-containing protein